MELQLKVVCMSLPRQKETSEVTSWLSIGLLQSLNGIVFTCSFFFFYCGDGTLNDHSQGNMNVSVI